MCVYAYPDVYTDDMYDLYGSTSNYIATNLYLSIYLFRSINVYQFVALVLHLCVRVRKTVQAIDSIRSAVDSAAVSTNATDSMATTDSRAGRPRWYRPVRSAQLHACALGSRATLRGAVVFCALCSMALTCAYGGDCVCMCARMRACVRVCVRASA
jgi:hypothetical protein